MTRMVADSELNPFLDQEYQAGIRANPRNTREKSGDGWLMDS